jgi:putative hydrolase of the HAD superfamily
MYRFIDRSEPMHDFVDQVRTAGYRTGIISNVLTEWLGIWETFTHPIDRFETVIYSCLDGMRKPDIEIFTTALERLGLAGNEVLYLDDGPGMVDVARRAGMTAILVDDHERAIDEARKLLAM